MNRFKNILYLTDGGNEETAVLVKVAELARLNGAKVTVARVGESTYLDQFRTMVPELFNRIDSAVRQQHRDEIDRIIGAELWGDVTISAAPTETADFIEVIRQVILAEHDLVIKKGAIEGGIDQLAMRLIRKCPCPVWIIQHTHSGDFQRILAAVDLSASGPEAVTLNRKIVELAHSLAQRENGEAHFMHAWRLEYESLLRSARMKMKNEELAAVKEMVRRQRESAFSDLFSAAGVAPAAGNVHLVEDETPPAIDSLLDRLAIDVLVMGTVGRTGIPGLLIGNMAETVLRSINCTVLTVKPDGFVSPVTI